MSTDKPSLAERIDAALAASDLTPEQADAERLEEQARLRKAMRSFGAEAKTLTPGQAPEDRPRRARKPL